MTNVTCMIRRTHSSRDIVAVILISNRASKSPAGPPTVNQFLLPFLAHTWSGFIYAFPPLHLSLSTVEKALSSRATASILLVVPDWPCQPWYLLLHEFLPTSVPLGRLPDITRNPITLPPISNVSTWKATHLRAFFLPQIR